MYLSFEKFYGACAPKPPLNNGKGMEWRGRGKEEERERDGRRGVRRASRMLAPKNGF
jgi:hypothetical protein